MATSRLSSITLRRGLSTSAHLNKLAAAPISVFGIEGRYAHAVYSAATKEKKVDIIEKELLGFRDIMVKDARVKDYVQNPVVKKTEKQETLQRLLAAQNCSNITINLFDALSENGRLNRISGVINAYMKIMSAHRGEVVCTITSAKPLDPAQRKDLEAALTGFLKGGQKLFLETKVDPAIMGGLIVNIGDRFVDMSLATKIKTYAHLLEQSI